MRFFVITIFLLFLPNWQGAFACSASQPEHFIHHRDLVAGSTQIALVRVVGSSENNHDATLITHEQLAVSNVSLAIFEPIKILKGSVPTRFMLSSGGLIKARDDAIRDLNEHRNIGFWAKKSTQTRNSHDADCKMHPGFVLGRIYLVFFDNPHLKAYEEIRTKDDLWLQAVQQMIDNPNAQSGITMWVNDWVSMATGIFKGSVQSCDGPVLWVDEVLKGTYPSFLGFHYWWRYRADNETGYWDAGPCIEGNDYLVLSSYDEAVRLPFGKSIVAPINGGMADLRAGIEASEIPIEGPSSIKLDDVRALFESDP